MKPSPCLITARCVLAFAALCAAGAQVEAGPAEDMQQAETLIRAGDVPTAMTVLRRVAQQDHPAAQARLADLLHSAEHDDEAVLLYRKAADKGEAAGEFGLGVMYAEGAGVPRDAALALEWYRKAEKKNYPRALDALARAYRTGSLGLAKDPAQAQALDDRRLALPRPAAGTGR